MWDIGDEERICEKIYRRSIEDPGLRDEAMVNG